MEAILPVIGFFVIRLGVPILIMVFLSWGVSRVVSREEARAEAKAQVEPAVSAPRQRVPRKRCWEIKGCAQTAMAKCPAVLHSDLPCWLARQLAAGKMLATCPACAIYKAGAAATGD